MHLKSFEMTHVRSIYRLNDSLNPVMPVLLIIILILEQILSTNLTRSINGVHIDYRSD